MFSVRLQTVCFVLKADSEVILGSLEFCDLDELGYTDGSQHVHLFSCGFSSVSGCVELTTLCVCVSASGPQRRPLLLQMHSV